ncbi:MAG: fibrobacter succinogenes major paralogous domain-containing protein [Bacteroidota bacterium]
MRNQIKYLIFTVIFITVIGLIISACRKEDTKPEAKDIVIDFVAKGVYSSIGIVEVVNLSNCTKIEVRGNDSLNLTKVSQLNTNDFSFTMGDMLKLKGISGNNAFVTVVIVEPIVSATYIFNFVACTDGDGNNYTVVEIGDQTWMAENLKTTSYVGGDDIARVENITAWGELENDDTDKAYCYYNNVSENGNNYGALYTYAAATNGDNSGVDVQGACPSGWHLPNDTEWTELIGYLEGEDVAGGKLKSICMGFWNSPNEGATNETGFSAISGGFRHFTNGMFFGLGEYTYYWSATQSSGTNAGSQGIYNNKTNIYSYHELKSAGLSVRCVAD